MTRSIYQFYTRANTGEIVPNAEVSVFFAGAGEAPIYDAETGGSLITQPLIATASAKAVFYIEPGIYDVQSKDPVLLTTATFADEEIGTSREALIDDNQHAKPYSPINKPDAVEVVYDNSVTGLSATETQSAIDENNALIDEIPVNIINDISQAYEFNSIKDTLGFGFVDKKIAHIKDFILNSNDGFGGEWVFDSSALKSTHDGSFVISPTVPWDGLGGQSQQDFIDQVGETDGGGSGCLVRQFNLKRASDLKPLFIEQFLTGFHGRGQLDVEPDGITTEQIVINDAFAGDLSVLVVTGSDFKEGGRITIEHENGKYWTYHISDVSGNVVSFFPPLKYDVINTVNKCERTWFNKAHAGKFYMRQLSQRIATEIEYTMSMPEKRVFMSQFDTNPNEDIDILSVVGGASISYFDADNIGAVDVGSIPRFNIGRTAFIGCSTVNDGAKSFVFQNTGAGTVNLRMVVSSTNSDMGIRIAVWSDLGESIPEFDFSITPGEDLQTPQYYDLPITLKGSSNTFFVTITANILGSAGSIQLDQLDIFETTGSNNSVFSPNEKKVLVALGDSWIQGDLGNSLEREPIPYQLQAELPYVKIINKGVGGDTATDILARFDADVTPNNPDYVLINVGTNDAYSPISGTFFPNAVEGFIIQLTNIISKCQAIGAKPILIGVPALAESDLTFSAYELNDRVRLYSQYFTKNIGRLIASTSVGNVSESGNVPTGSIIERNINGVEICTKFADGTQICTREIALDTAVTSGINVSFLEGFLIGTIPACSMSIQTVGGGNTITAMKDAFMRCGSNTDWIVNFPTAGTDVETFNLTAIGRWY